MQTVKLNNGVEMPILGFGVYQIDDANECERSVREAIEVGYRSIDTASAYFNEEAVGKAIHDCGVPREELFITTKLWVSDAGEVPAEKAFYTSLKKLGLDYLDLYLIHQPFGDVYGSWRAMEKLYRAGKIRAIGVSNFLPDRIQDFVLNQEITPAVNQIETHPFLQQRATQEFLKNAGIQIESWGPFAEGKNGLFTNPVLKNIAEKHGKSVAQIVLRWLVQRGVVVIPKSTHKDRMTENIAVFDFSLDDADLNAIGSLDTGVSWFLDHRDPEMVKFLCSLFKN